MGNTGGVVFRAFSLQPDNTWMAGPNVAINLSFYSVTPPSRGPTSHVLWMGLAGDGLVHESVETSPGTWTEPNPSFSFPGIATAQPTSLSDDGLRLVFIGTDASLMSHAYYTDRPSLDQPFRTPDVLTGVPASDLFMTSDCGRIYLSDNMHAIFFTLEK
jgi:hypothetical protein